MLKQAKYKQLWTNCVFLTAYKFIQIGNLLLYLNVRWRVLFGIIKIFLLLLKIFILSYYFDGAKKGQREFFAENLPGFPDNIRISSTNNNIFYIGLASIRHSAEMAFVDKAGSYPLIRYIIYQVNFFVNYI